MAHCRERRFDVAFNETLALGLPARFRWSSDSTPHDPWTLERFDDANFDADSAVGFLVQGRIHLEFRHFQAAIPVLEAAAILMADPGSREPFANAAQWAAAAARACRSRITGASQAMVDTHTPQQQRLDELVTLDDQIKQWLHIYKSTSLGRLGDVVVPDDPSLQSPEAKATLCRYYRNLVRRNQANPDTREEARNFISDAQMQHASAVTEHDYDSILGFTTHSATFAMHLGLLHRQLGEYDSAIGVLSPLVDGQARSSGADSDLDAALGYPMPEATVALVACKRMYRRGHDESLEDEIASTHIPKMVNESFVVHDQDKGHDLGDRNIELRTAMLNRFSADSANEGLLPGVIPQAQPFIHRQLAGVVRHLAALRANRRPSKAYALCVAADHVQNQAGFLDGWGKAPSVRTLARSTYLLRMGEGPAAIEEIQAAMGALNLDAITVQGVAGSTTELVDLKAVLTERCQSDEYNLADKQSDWRAIRSALCATDNNATQRDKIAMTVMAAADLFRTIDRMSVGLLWYDALSSLHTGLGAYIEFTGLDLSHLHTNGDRDATIPSWAAECGNPLCATKGATDTTSRSTDCGVVAPTLRFLPLARALSSRWHMGQAVEGLKIAIEHFTYGSNDLSAELKADLTDPEKHKQLVETLTLLPDELTKEIGVAYLQVGDLDRASACFQALMSTRWELGRVSGIVGLMDVWRRQRDLQLIRNDGRRSKSPTPTDEPIEDHSPEQLSDLSQVARAAVKSAKLWAEVHMGDPRRARDLAQEAIKVIPYDISVWLGWIRALRMLGDHKEALDILRWLLNEQTNRPDMLLTMADDGTRTSDLIFEEDPSPGIRLRHEILLRSELGWTYLDLDQTDNAAPQFEVAVTRGRRFVAIHRGLLNVCPPIPSDLAARRDHSLEIAYGAGPQGSGRAGFSNWRRALQRDMALELGKILCQHGYVDEARREFEEAYRLSADLNPVIQTQITHDIVNAYLEADQLLPAERILRYEDFGAPEVSYNAVVAMLEARLKLATGATQDAVDDLADAARQSIAAAGSDASTLVTSTDLPEALRMAYLIALYENRDFNCVIELTNQLDEANMMTNRLRHLQAWALLARSELPDNLKKADDVIKAAAIVDLTEPLSASDHHLNAMVNMQINRVTSDDQAKRSAATPLPDRPIELALQSLQEAIRRRPSDGTLYRDRAAIQMEIGEIDKAEHSLWLATNHSPPDARIYLLKGSAAFRRGDYSGAERFFRSAVARDPNDHVHFRELAVTLSRLGDYSGAIKVCEHGKSRVRTYRRWILELLKADILVSQSAATTSGFRQRPELLVQAATLLEEMLKVKDLGSWYRREAAFRLAKIYFHRRRRDEAKKIMRRYRLTGPDSPFREKLAAIEKSTSESQLVVGFLRPKLWRAVLLVGIVLLSLGQLVPMIVTTWFYVTEPGREADPIVGVDGSTTALLLVISALLFVVSVYRDQITTIRFQSAEVELSNSQAITELVHNDLDLSASRSFRINGLSAFRPEVPFTDLDARFVASPQ